MNSESGQRLSMEELKQLNQTQAAPSAAPMPEQVPLVSRQDLEDLLVAVSALYRLEKTQNSLLDRLERHASAHTALLREASAQAGNHPTQEQMAALTRDVAQMRAELKQAGRKREISVSPPSLRTALSVLIWLALILLGTMVGMVALQTIWSGLSALWSVIRILVP